MEREVYKDGYRDQIVTSCGCVSAFQDTFTVHVVYTVMAHQYPSLFPVLFLQSLLCPFLYLEPFFLGGGFVGGLVRPGGFCTMLIKP